MKAPEAGPPFFPPPFSPFFSLPSIFPFSPVEAAAQTGRQDAYGKDRESRAREGGLLFLFLFNFPPLFEHRLAARARMVGEPLRKESPFPPPSLPLFFFLSMPPYVTARFAEHEIFFFFFFFFPFFPPPPFTPDRGNRSSRRFSFRAGLFRTN